MRPPRSSQRINLRFPSFAEMDEAELIANSVGLDLQNWLRWLVRRELNRRRKKEKDGSDEQD